jgi:hypothetical protein
MALACHRTTGKHHLPSLFEHAIAMSATVTLDHPRAKGNAFGL